MTLGKLAVVILVLGAAGCALFFTSDTTGAEARSLVSGGARLIDVRSPEEFAAGHLEGAVNVPVGELEARLAEVGPKEVPVVVYCRSGNRSSRAQKLLRERGWREVRNLGPKSYW